MAQGVDAGYQGRAVSLANVQGRENVGLIVTRPDAAIAFNPGVLILQSNPNRAWALIQNLDTNNLTFSFDSGTGIAPTFILPANGILQIDRNLPWTGAVYLASGTGSVSWMEASVQP